MPDTVAFIDVGTNSIHMLVVRFYEGSLGTSVYQDKETVRMGKSLYETGVIDEPTLNKVKLVLSNFASIAKEHGADKIVAMATCAAREAPNSADLVNVAKECGIVLHIIPGYEEARLTRLGTAGPECARKTLCIDVGGGSTEIALASGKDDLYLDSLSLGAIRMAFGTGIDQHRKVSQKQYDALRNYVDAQCYHTVGVVRAQGFEEVIGSSGTIEAIADACAVRRGDGDATYIDRSELKALMKMLCGMSAEERSKIPKISASRADIVIGGGVIVDELMTLLNIERMTVSRCGLREGMKIDYLLKKGHSDFSIRASSVKALAARCGRDTKHEKAVEGYALSLYDEFTRVGLMERSDLRELLGYAAELHDVGSFISYEKHNVFSYIIIRNSYLAGFDSAELEKIALMARFHHNAFPGTDNKFLVSMDRREVRDLLKCALILKMADILDRGRDSSVEEINAEELNGNINLRFVSSSDLSLAKWKMDTVTEDFLRVFGSRLHTEFLHI